MLSQVEVDKVHHKSYSKGEPVFTEMLDEQAQGVASRRKLEARIKVERSNFVNYQSCRKV